MRAELEKVWARSLPLLLERVAVVERAIAGLGDGSATEELRAAAEAEAHKLAGVLGTFGLDRGTELARELERGLADPSRAGAARLRSLAAELRSLLSATSP